ncbi:hypothetical protein Dimus_015917, partial [Dionaea muscipula]
GSLVFELKRRQPSGHVAVTVWSSFARAAATHDGVNRAAAARSAARVYVERGGYDDAHER